MYQALYRKWRPRTFDDVVGQDHITDILRSQVISGRLSHAYLFTGTRGTGKTTCAKILSKAVNCLSPVNGSPCNSCPACTGIDSGSIMDVVEIDAASNNGVDNVRALRDEAVFTPASVRMRVYIIDEVHMLSPSAFNALLKIMEEPPEHLMFILATTEVHKVPATVLSRCQRFAFRRLPASIIEQRLLHVASCENIALEPDAARLLAGMSDGAMRDALSLLDQCAAASMKVDVGRVYESSGMAGREEIKKLLFAVLDSQTGHALDVLDGIYYSGANLPAVLDELSELCRDMLIYIIAPGGAFGKERAPEEDVRAKADAVGKRVLMDVLEGLRNYRSRTRYSSDELVDTQLCIMELCAIPEAMPDSLLRRVELLEKKLRGGAVLSTPEKPSAQEPAAQNVPERPEAPEKGTVSREEQVSGSEERVSRPRESGENGEVRHGESAGSAEQTSAGSEDGAFDWKQVLERARPRLSFADVATLENPSLAAASMEGSVLRIRAMNDFVLLRLRDEKLKAALKEASGASFVVIGDEEAPVKDRFSELLSIEGKYGNIIVE